jgi:ABC-type Fe3+-citrate transport system substrate-binding protein
MQKKVIKAELGLVDDLLSMKKKWDQLYNEEIQTRNQLSKIISKYKEMDKEAASMYNKSMGLFQEASKKAKELGVSESQINGLDALADYIQKDVSGFARKEVKRL